jgi:hypothetical protein
MSDSLAAKLKWGGIVLAIVAAIAIAYVKTLAADGGAGAPVILYWILLLVGAVAAVIGATVQKRRQADSS